MAGEIIMKKNNKKLKNQLEDFLRECKISKKKGRLLEIGFKNGYFLEEARKNGFDVYGTEVSKEYLKETKKRFPKINIVLEKNNRIPYEDNSMDFVVSFQVLEHVASLDDVLKEAYRVLRPGGLMYQVFPNYNSFYEGHYNVIWLPFLNKKLGRFYLKILGRYSKYYESLNIVKPKFIKKKLSKFNLEIVSLGKKEFINNFNINQIKKIQVKIVKKVCVFFIKIGFLRKFFLNIVVFSNLHYPIKIIAKKNN